MEMKFHMNQGIHLLNLKNTHSRIERMEWGKMVETKYKKKGKF